MRQEKQIAEIKNVVTPCSRSGILPGYRSMVERNDDADAVAAQNGDTAAKDRLARAYLPVAKRIAGRVGGREVDDAAQNAMLALLGAIERFDPERDKPFRVYAHAAIRWAIVRSSCAELPEAPTVSLDAPPSSADLDLETRHDVVADAAAVNPEVETARRELPSVLTRRQRSVFLRRLAGETDNEIASTLGTTRRAVSLLAERARRAVAAA